jgi:hypothetical protein
LIYIVWHIPLVRTRSPVWPFRAGFSIKSAGLNEQAVQILMGMTT